MQKNLYIPIDTTIENTVECEKLVKRGDTLILTIKVFINGILADLTGQSIDLILKKSDNTLIEQTITSVSNGVITATLDVQATNVAGQVSGEIQIYTSNTLASTNTFNFNVDTSLADDVLAKSQDDIEVLADIKNVINEGNDAIDKYKTNVEAIANTAEAVEALSGIKNYIDTNLSELESENAKALVNIQNEDSQNTQSVKNIADLTALNNAASTLKTGLESDIATGNTLKTNLENDITNGSTLKNNLETDITAGNMLKNNLESDITTATNSKTALDSSITNANTVKSALEADIATAQSNSFVNEITNARGTYANLKARLDNSDSQLSEKANDTDSTRTTTAKTVTGAINELNANKINKTSIVNNLLATVTGSVLDATQGKALNDSINTILNYMNMGNSVSALNNATKFGVYRFDTTTLNLPFNNIGICLVIPFDINFIVQIAFQLGQTNGSYYIRQSSNSIFSSWVQK